MASYILVLQWPIELGGGAPLRRGRTTAPDTPPVSLGSSSTQSFNLQVSKLQDLNVNQFLSLMMRRVTRANTGPNEVTINFLGVQHEWGHVGAEVLWLVG